MVSYRVKSDLTVVDATHEISGRVVVDQRVPADEVVIVSDKSMTYIEISDMTKHFLDSHRNPVKPYSVKIEKVKFSGPATIVFWADGSKTVVKCQEGDTFDPEKGLALCFMKKVLGNKSGTFNKVLKMYGKEESYDNT